MSGFHNPIHRIEALAKPNRDPESGRGAQQRSSAYAKRLREEFAFLNDPDTPIELQALVTRRISAYHEYRRLWWQLFECSTPDDCAAVAGKLIEAFLDNRASLDELKFFQEHHEVLGKHPIFAERKRNEQLRGLSVRELIRRQEKVKNNIWRVKSEMKKNDKPQLDERRRQRLRDYERELAELNRLLGDN